MIFVKNMLTPIILSWIYIYILALYPSTNRLKYLLAMYLQSGEAVIYLDFLYLAGSVQHWEQATICIGICQCQISLQEMPVKTSCSRFLQPSVISVFFC